MKRHLESSEKKNSEIYLNEIEASLLKEIRT